MTNFFPLEVKECRVSSITSVLVPASAFVENLPCPVCESLENTKVLGELAGSKTASLRTRCCEACVHVYLERRPNQAWYASLYKDNWKTGVESSEGMRARAKAQLHKLQGAVETVAENSLFKNRGVSLASLNKVVAFCERFELSRRSFRGKSVLEVGCGFGKTLHKFVQLGAHTFGLEATPHRARAAAQLGVRVKNVPLEELSEGTFERKFDLILIHHVLEHLFDPNVFFAKAKALLNPGGMIYIAVPNVFHSHLLEIFHSSVHTNEFSPSSLQKMLEKHGFALSKLSVDHELQMLAQLAKDSESAFVYPRPQVPAWETFQAYVDRNLAALGSQEKSYVAWSYGKIRVSTELSPEERESYSYFSLRNAERGRKASLPMRLIYPGEIAPIWSQ